MVGRVRGALTDGYEAVASPWRGDELEGDLAVEHHIVSKADRVERWPPSYSFLAMSGKYSRMRVPCPG